LTKKASKRQHPTKKEKRTKPKPFDKDKHPNDNNHQKIKRNGANNPFQRQASKR
jgi:hypothetical protein